MGKLPESVIERLSAYRRLLEGAALDLPRTIFSHELGSMAGATAAQVRRDLMTIGVGGNPARGYEIERLLGRIGEILDPHPADAVVLVGTGQIGRALLAYFARRRPDIRFVAAFDRAPELVGRILHGCPVHAAKDMEGILRELRPRAGVVAVPRDAAQDVAEHLVGAGVRGILNFAPVRLRVPEGVYVEDVDIATSVEKVLFFARLSAT